LLYSRRAERRYGLRRFPAASRSLEGTLAAVPAGRTRRQREGRCPHGPARLRAGLWRVYVESSQGHIGTTFYEANNTPRELEYEASYAVVQYAKARCVELYGKEPAYAPFSADRGAAS